MEEFAWIVDASGRAAHAAKVLGAAKRYRFGYRRIVGEEVRLFNTEERHTCWIETAPEG